MKVKINFHSKYNKAKPKIRVSTTNTSVETHIPGTMYFEDEFHILKDDNLTIEFLNKDGIDNNIVFIKSIEIDGINLQHYIYDGTFFPEYDRDWLEKQTVTPPNSYKPCTELRVKGKWKLGITTPIWKMIMEKWLHDNR